MEEFLQVGAIANTHGIAGEGKIYSMTDDIMRFKKLKEVYLDTGRERMLLHVVSCKFVKNQPVLKFREFKNINEIEPGRPGAGRNCCPSYERIIG